MQMRSKPIIDESNRIPVAYLLGVMGVIAFGATLPVTKIALNGFTPEFLTFARAVIATGLALVSMLVFGRRLYHRNNVQLFISGVFLIFAFPGFMAIAMQTVPSAYGGVVLGFLPLATAIFAKLFAQEAPSRLFWILSISGCALVIAYIFWKAGDTQTGGSWVGYAWLVAAGLSASAGYVMFGKLSRETQGWEIICRALILNAPLTLAGAVWFFDAQVLEAATASIIALVYLGVFSMFLAFCVWNIALAWGGIAKIGQLQLLQVFVTIAVASALLGETIDAITLITACTVTAIVAATKKA